MVTACCSSCCSQFIFFRTGKSICVEHLIYTLPIIHTDHKNECPPCAEQTWHSFIIIEPKQIQQPLTDKAPSVCMHMHKSGDQMAAFNSSLLKMTIICELSKLTCFSYTQALGQSITLLWVCWCVITQKKNYRHSFSMKSQCHSKRLLNGYKAIHVLCCKYCKSYRNCRKGLLDSVNRSAVSLPEHLHQKHHKKNLTKGLKTLYTTASTEV